MKKLFFLLLLLSAGNVMAQKKLPPTMGWSSWNTYASKITSNIIKKQADAMVKSGLDTCGYRYINIDDGFQKNRDSKGNLVIDPTRFPSMRQVVEYIHAKGLKAGIYSDAGHNTCASFYGGESGGVGVGLLDHDTMDCQFYFNDLGFDFIKVDFCGGNAPQNSEGLALDPQERYTQIAQAIASTGCDVAFNVCRWAFPGTWVMDIADSWRVTGDIYDSWNSVKSIIGENLYLSVYCGRGHYNDMDMLEVGRSMTAEEDRTHFGMWCIMSSPLLIGCDISGISAETRALLGNPELIALNQDTLGLQAHVVQHAGDTYVLVKDIEQRNGLTRAVALYNPSDVEAAISIPYVDLDLSGKVKVRDLYAREDVQDAPLGTLSATVPAHGCRIYRLEAECRLEQALYEAESAYLTCYQETTNNQSAQTAEYDGMSGASNGEIAGWLGTRPENDLQWRDVYSKEGGDYTMTLSYISGENRKFIVAVNGEDVITKTVNSGSWSTIKTVDIPVTLHAGYNTIRLYTDESGWMPNFDCMTLYKTGSVDKQMRELETLRASLQSVSENDVTPAIKEKINSLLATDTEAMDATQLNSLVSSMSTTLETARSMEDYCHQFALWLQNTEKNMAASVESEALTDLQTSLRSAMDGYNASTTKSKVSTALSRLKSALRSYLKAETSAPREGESLDMTLLLNNPDFSATAGWTEAPTYSQGVGEFYNTPFDIHQTLTGLKSGEYTVTANILYRTAKNDGGAAYQAGTEVIPALFYANKDSVAVSSIYSAPFYDQSGSWSTTDVKNGYTNSMYSASLMFARGYYLNSVSTTVSDGKLRVGIACSSALDDCWCCFDDFHISYQPSEATGINAISTTGNNTSGCYNLSGQFVPEKTKGVVIKNGRAVLNQ